jgi:hypothetical protein
MDSGEVKEQGSALKGPSGERFWEQTRSKRQNVAFTYSKELYGHQVVHMSRSRASKSSLGRLITPSFEE